MNTFKKVFLITNKNISLATPLILYSLLSTVYLAVSAYDKIINLFCAFILFLLMTVAFIAGWFYIIKQTILSHENDNMHNMFKTFTEGVGGYFLSALGASFVIIVIYTILMTIAIYLGVHFIGNPHIDSSTLSNSLKSTTELKLFLSDLSESQLSKLGMWNVLILTSTSIANFLLILYLPALFLVNRNPIKAFGINIANLFSKKIFNTLYVYLIIYLLYIATSIVTALVAGNIILHLIITLINFYFIVLVFVGIFYYYYNNFIDENKSQKIDLRI